MAEIINFRPTPDVAQMIESQKAKGVNISRWINNLLIGADKQADSLNLQIYTIPEDGINLYDSTKLAIDQMISLHSLPFSRLSISRYREANDIIKQASMDYYRFKIDEDNYISIIAVNREEASVEFSRYYMKSENKEYVRTSVPLPVYRFDVKNKVVIIIASE